MVFRPSWKITINKFSGKPSALQRKHPALQNKKFSDFFLFLGSFWLLVATGTKTMVSAVNRYFPVIIRIVENRGERHPEPKEHRKVEANAKASRLRKFPKLSQTVSNLLMEVGRGGRHWMLIFWGSRSLLCTLYSRIASLLCILFGGLGCVGHFVFLEMSGFEPRELSYKAGSLPA